MFDKIKFAQILKNINDTYNSQRDFAEKSKINRTYLSQYMNLKLDEPPKPKILERLANASNGIVTYKNLMVICGYVKYDSNTEKVQEVISYIADLNYASLKNTINKLFDFNLSSEELLNVSNSFRNCCNYIIDDYYNDLGNKNIPYFKNNLTKFEQKGYNCLYISLIKKLHSYCNVPKKDEIISLRKHLILPDDNEDVTQCLNIINGMKEYYVSSINNFINSSRIDNLGNLVIPIPILRYSKSRI